MSENSATKTFQQRVDEFIALANQQAAESSVDDANTAIIFSAARFNAFSVARKVETAENLKAEKQAAIEYFMKTHGGRSFLHGHMFGDHVHEYLAPCIYEGEGEMLGMAFFKSLVKQHGKRLLVIHHDEAEALEDTLDMDIFSPPRQDWLDGTDTYFHQPQGAPPTKGGCVRHERMPLAQNSGRATNHPWERCCSRTVAPVCSANSSS